MKNISFVLLLAVLVGGCGLLNSPKKMDYQMNVKKTDDKVYIEGVKGFSGCEFVSSVHGCHARVLEYLGESTSYDDLVCYSGFAFRASVHEEYCPSAGHPCCGYMCVENSNRALGWDVKVYNNFPWSAPKADMDAFKQQVRAAVKESIDRGVPVQYSSEEDGLIIGYGDNGNRWWCIHPYYREGKESFWHDEVEGFAGGKWPWCVAIWQKAQPAAQRADEKVLTALALKQAVDMWKSEKVNAYYVGSQAYDYWIDYLEAVNSGSKEPTRQGMHSNGWCFEVLAQNRQIAGKWLGERADIFGAEAAEKLKLASENYSQVAKICTEGLESTWSLTGHPDGIKNWTVKMRDEQLRRLKKAKAKDAEAVELIAQALDYATAIMGVQRRIGDVEPSILDK